MGHAIIIVVCLFIIMLTITYYYVVHICTTKVAPCGFLATFLHRSSQAFIWLRVGWAIGGVRLAPIRVWVFLKGHSKKVF